MTELPASPRITGVCSSFLPLTDTLSSINTVLLLATRAAPWDLGMPHRMWRRSLSFLFKWSLDDLISSGGRVATITSVSCSSRVDVSCSIVVYFDKSIHWMVYEQKMQLSLSTRMSLVL